MGPKNKRCPNGTRKNKRGDCVDKNGIVIVRNEDDEAIMPEAPLPEAPAIMPEAQEEQYDQPEEVEQIPVEIIHEEIQEPAKPKPKNKTQRANPRCPKGTRRNREGKCVREDGTVVDEKPPAKEPAAEVQIPLEKPIPVWVQPSDEAVLVVDTKKTRKSGMNAFLAEKERIEHSRYPKTEDEEARTKQDPYNFLYPDINDPLFNIKLAKRKEFQETQFDGTIYDIRKQADALCNAKFELLPHQRFVKNFLSMQSPYNSLLLYHGLGTGKTCSAIGIAEDMRRYMIQVGIRDKILIVASPNVQGNFRSQLFDESKLVQITNKTNPNEYTWNIESCVGDSLLREIDPDSVRNVPKEKIVSNIQAIISTWYEFMGYGQLANYITNKTKVSEEAGYSAAERKEMELKKIRAVFNGKNIIIDEVHNISQQTDDNKHKTTGTLLMHIAKYANNMRLLLLSATPMFDTYKEIIWLTNLMNVNDNRSSIDVQDVFDSAGNIKDERVLDKSGNPKETGRELLTRKLTGYVSYVRGENPYTFPFRVYPDTFAPENTYSNKGGIPYPEIQVNDRPVPSPLSHIKVYLNTVPAASYQYKAYKYIVSSVKQMAEEASGDMRELNNFDILQKPVECLNIVYPHPEFESAIAGKDDFGAPISAALGESGMNRVVSFVEKPGVSKNQFEYRPGVVEKYGRIFSQEILPKYSQKIARICNLIQNSEGIILIYSQYIDGGVVPMALALEEMGFAKYSSGGQQANKSLFRRPPGEALDATTMRKQSQVPPAEFRQAQYIMITGDKMYSPSNTADIAYAKHKDNSDGSRVKVILISKAGSEGLDFRHIRQIHIMEPWYNMNRIEQIIGRGVRNLSHCSLPFEKRNVQIFLHATRFEGDTEEPVDLYIYRMAEKKSILIGRVTRLLKTIAVDCILNVGQTNMTAEKLSQIAENQRISIQLSTGETVPFRVGDRPMTDICDYMETCDYTCSPSTPDISEKDIITATYTSDIVRSNFSAIAKRVRDLYRENHSYRRDQLISAIRIRTPYPLEHIYQVLSTFIDTDQETLIDKYDRAGFLVNNGEYYVFHPTEITDKQATAFDRSIPVPYKRKSITLELPKEIAETDVAAPEKDAAAPTAAAAVGYDEVIQQIIEQHAMTETPIETRGLDKNWYSNCSNVVDRLMETFHLSREHISQYVVDHSMDEMSYDKKMILVRHFYGKSRVEPGNPYEQMVLSYLEERISRNAERNRMAILLANKTEVVLSIRSIDGTLPEWKVAEQDDYRYFQADLKKHTFDRGLLNRVIGYIVDFKDREMIFKFKDITLTRNKLGARCDSAGKADILKMLNMVVSSEGVEQFTQENTVGFFQPRLCVMLELILREYTRIRKHNRIYFLTPEQSIVGEITR